MKKTSKKESEFGTDAFWADFTAHAWEKKSALIHIPRNSDILKIDAREIFKLIVELSDLCRKCDSVIGIKFYVNSIRLEDFETIALLPLASDRSLEGYDRRMRRQFDDYGLVCDELMLLKSPNATRHWVRLGTFIDGLYRHVGIPNRFSEMGLYLGTYKQTPFGVHIDACGVLSFPVIGQKNFRIWTPAFVAKNPELKEAFRYDEFKNDSLMLSALPGDMAYWPSTHWHIAENPKGQFSCTWSIGIWVDRTLADVTYDVLKPLISKVVKKSLGRRQAKTSTDLPNQNMNPKAIPDELDTIASAIAGLTKTEIKTVLQTWWREHTNRHGMKTTPNKKRKL